MNTEEKVKIRVATVSGSIIRKRCRKQESFNVMAVGLTDEEALCFLREKVAKELCGSRAYVFRDEVEISNGEKGQFGFSYSIFPEFSKDSDYVKLPFADVFSIPIRKEL